MINGVPVAAINPMKATLEPIDSMLRKSKKNGDSAEKTAISRR
jgi:hypothetical protein